MSRRDDPGRDIESISVGHCDSVTLSKLQSRLTQRIPADCIGRHAHQPIAGTTNIGFASAPLAAARTITG